MSPERSLDQGRAPASERYRKIELPQIPGVVLRFAPDVEVDLHQREMEQIAEWAQQFMNCETSLKEVQRAQKPFNDELIKLGQETGLRGIEFGEENRVVRITPRRDVQWNQELLKESLGSAYGSVVRETTGIELLIPPSGLVTESGIITARDVLEAIRNTLKAQGLEDKNIEQIVAQKTKLTVDEGLLGRLERSGQVSLTEGTRQVEYKWAVGVSALRA
ncbi:MAG: hypothetical protein ABH810_02005 [bacterium]